MRISEMSPDLRPSLHGSQTQVLQEIEVLIKEAERISPEKPPLEMLCLKLQKNLSRLSSFVPLSNSEKLQIWKLSYRLWNACVDLSNAVGIRSSCEELKIDEEQAKLRQISANLLFLSGDVVGIPSPALKSASFFYKTGLIWHDLKKFDLAANCFERATDLMSKIQTSKTSDAGEQRLLLDVNIARSRTAWQVSERNIALTLLHRSKSLLFGSPESYRVLANQYLTFGKLVLSQNQTSAFNDALKLMNEALDLSEMGLRIVRRPDETLGLKTVRSKSLRFMAAAHLQAEEFESVLKCIKVLREGSGDHHPCFPVLAMKAWLGLGRYDEAEKELKGMVVNKGIPESIWVSAVEAYFEAAGVARAETAKGLFLGLLGRCHVSAGAAVRVANRVVGSGGEGSRVRAKVVAELVSDERVVALFAEGVEVKERTAMHAILWNCGANHFGSKDYEIAAEMFEKSMLYVPHNVENRILRSKCFRILCLCHLGLSQLDRAQEYIDEAEKFKVFLQKNDGNGAINQMQLMASCLDFTPEFLSLSAHEAIASEALPVAIASLSNLLHFYSPGKSMPTSEVVVLRTLVTLLLRDTDNDPECLKFTKQAQTRMFELSPEQFFGKGEVGRRERNWFAVNSWNIGARTGSERKYQLCSEFLELASEFYAVKISGGVEENQCMVCKSLVLSVSATIAMEKQNNAALSDSEVKRALELLSKAEKILKLVSSGTQLKDDPATIEPSFYFICTFNTYNLLGRLADSGPQQLLLIKNFASSKMCTPQYLLQIGLSASWGPSCNLDITNYALSNCLSELLSSPSPDYQTVAFIIRKLIGLTGFKVDADDEAYSLYKQAYRVMVGLKEGEYPAEEGKWLAMTAWNRAAMPVRLGQIGIARKWMRIGLELGQYVIELVSYKGCMEEFFANFEKKFHGHSDGESNPQLVL